MLKRFNFDINFSVKRQPPLGGCVLKRITMFGCINTAFQPPLGGCVLKRPFCGRQGSRAAQPPLGGCVLKLAKEELTIAEFASRL